MAEPKKPKVVDDKDFGVTHGGTVITEELAEQWATEIESEDFDLTHWERCDDGRPLLAQSDTEPGVAFPLSSSELGSLRLRAWKEVARSAIWSVRRWIRSGSV